MDSEMKINGDRVRALREEKSWSQEHLAAAAGLSVRTVQRVESDGMGSAETRLSLAGALGIPVSTLMPPPAAGFSTSSPRVRIPAAAWMGWGIGATCALGAVTYNYFSGHMDAAEAGRSLGVIFALLGTMAGTMAALSGWLRSRLAA